jgi:hypothetical protein
MIFLNRYTDWLKIVCDPLNNIEEESENDEEGDLEG